MQRIANTLKTKQFLAAMAVVGFVVVGLGNLASAAPSIRNPMPSSPPSNMNPDARMERAAANQQPAFPAEWGSPGLNMLGGNNSSGNAGAPASAQGSSGGTAAQSKTPQTQQSNTPTAENKQTGAQPSGGGKPETGFTGWLFEIVIKVLYAVLKFVSLFMVLAMKLLDLTMDPKFLQSMVRSQALTQAWKLVRDFLNMFFIIILLFSAICTILRIDKYSAKKMLFSIVLAALLINFSKPITLVVIDTSQLAMQFFYENIVGQQTNLSNGTTGLEKGKLGYSTAQLAESAGLGEALNYNNIKPNEGNASIDVIVGLLASITFVVIFTIIIFVLALGLLFRIVSFWVLLILSPIAFFSLAMPGSLLQGGMDGWLKKLVHWSFYGPLQLFFLWLAIFLLNGVLAEGSALSMKISSDIPLIVGVLNKVIPYAVAIYLLFYGYEQTKNFAAGAGRSVTDLMGRGDKWMQKGLKYSLMGGISAGTLGLAPAAYIGGKTAGSLTGSYFTGKRRALAKKKGLGWLKPDRMKELKERAEARGAGETDKYLQKKTFEVLKKWDSEGMPITDKLKDIMVNSKKPEEQRAAALQLAKDGELKSKDDFTNAVKAMGDDPVLMKQLRDSAGKKNMFSMLQHDIANDKEKVIDSGVAAEEKRRGAPMNDADKAAWRSYMSGLNDDDFKRQALEDKMDGMKLRDIADQDISLHSDAQFMDVMQKYKTVDQRFSQKSLEYTVANMDANKAAKWKSATLI